MAALVRLRFGLGPAELEALTDEEFIDLAGLAYFAEDRQAEAIKRGLLEALAELVKH